MFIVEMNRYFAVYEKMRKLYTTIFFTIIHTQRSKPKIFQMKYKYLKLSLVTDNKHSKHSQFLLPSEHQLLPQLSADTAYHPDIIWESNIMIIPNLQYIF